MKPINDYLDHAEALLETIRNQAEDLSKAASWFADTILAERMVHVFGSGHSRIMVEETWPRYGSFPGFNPIVELSLTHHTQVVGANGQRQAMFLENVSGLAARILRNFDCSDADSALVVSSSGCNIVPIEMAEAFQELGIRVVAIVSKAHLEASESKREDGKKLNDFADLVLDTGAPAGDAMVKVEGLDLPVSPGSTVGGCLIVNAIKAEVARLLTEAGKPPKALTATCVIGKERAAQIFEAAYDEHARLLAKLYENLGQ
ncbi:MAG: SIS domain-containing protein [Opitutae bacterium]|nr:SIS domain-containing protein [Opitutae bacterium]|tara:strand:- start:11392 stop:12171 length:780 start_codon:yes stop_codon:yes gene_type:complete